MELALSQQLHRQRYGRYAQDVSSNGTPNANRLILPSSAKYRVLVSNSDFRGYRAEVTPSAGAPLKLPEACRTLIVESDMGIQRFGARSAANQNTSDRCVPHG